MVAMPSAAVSALVPASSTAADAAAAPAAKPAAAAGVKRPLGSGRDAVRFMRASSGFSISWFSAPADAAASAVPVTAASRPPADADAAPSAPPNGPAMR